MSLRRSAVAEPVTDRQHVDPPARFAARRLSVVLAMYRSPVLLFPLRHLHDHLLDADATAQRVACEADAAPRAHPTGSRSDGREPIGCCAGSACDLVEPLWCHEPSDSRWIAKRPANWRGEPLIVATLVRGNGEWWPLRRRGCPLAAIVDVPTGRADTRGIAYFNSIWGPEWASQNDLEVRSERSHFPRRTP